MERQKILDREQGVAFIIDTSRFRQIIQMDAVKPRNLFLVAVKDKILTDGKYHNTVIMGRFNYNRSFARFVRNQHQVEQETKRTE
ncbi:hypothetical protein L8C07_15515 [Paenibacillus sp. CMAA1739]|nr:hypothetical protein [Paenibacillus sp. CMAA1739]MEC4567355.1 hypothetical protein [Paenibacillus sp. CMAA1739]